MPASLDGLDRAQLAAVTHRGGPLLVLGGPGTGKTHVLARRVAWLIEEGTAADEALVIAPTDAAASDLRVRLETLIETPYDELSVHSAHELCERILRDEALEAGLDPLFSPVSAADRLALLLERIDDLPLRRHEIRGNPAPLLAGFVERIDRLKEEMVQSQQFRRWAEGRCATAASDDERTHAERELEFAHVYAAHDRLLASTGALDVGDLTLHAFRLLHEKPHVRTRLAARFPFVLADGYQDLSFAQAAMTRLLTQDRRELTVAGNDDEAVRRTRGRAAKNLRDFTAEHPDATTVVLTRSRRVSKAVLDAAAVVVAPSNDRLAKRCSGGRGAGTVRFWRCQTERAQAQAVAAEVERLVERNGVVAADIAVFVPSLKDDGPVVAAALEERAIPFRLVGGAAYFQRAEVRDLLAWLRALANPSDAGAVVRALSRPPVDLRSVDIALITQLSRRRKLDMVAAAALAIEGPHLSPEGRDRVQSFLRLYRAAAQAFERMRADAFVHRLIERIGLRRQQLFAAQADTLERLMSIAKLGDLATAYMRREPHATPRDFARYIAAVAESGLPEPEPEPTLPDAVRITETASAEELESEHAFVLGLTAAAMPGRAPDDRVPDELMPETVLLTGREAHEERMRRVLYVAMTRARRGLVLAWPEADGARPSPFMEEVRAASSECEEEFHEEELFGPAEGLHSTFRLMRDELLDTVARMGGRLKEMRLDTYVDISHAMVRYLELIKVAALIERHRDGEPLPTALREINELLLQVATPEQREAFEQSALDEYLLDAARDERRRAEAVLGGRAEPALDRFIPRRGDGVMLSASDVETYRLCPLKYKFARVFRIPEEPTINQRFGIAVHQVLERFHAQGGGSLEDLMHLFEVAWRRNGFGHSADELQFREKAVTALTRYWELDRDRDGEPVWFERGFAFKLGEHFVRGRVDRVDRLPDGSYELIDYKTGWPKTEQQLREDIQLSLYQMGAREAWGLPGSAQSYYYVLENEKVPVEHTDDELERVRTTVTEIADGILSQEFEPRPRPDICAVCDYRIICPAAEK
jgi:ATP-dependent DNA helicase UvrD/PcrA